MTQSTDETTDETTDEGTILPEVIPLPACSHLFRGHRTRLSLAPEQAADRIGISFAALESYERGRRVPRPAALVRVYEVYELSEDDQYELLLAIVRERPASYRWAEALIRGGNSQDLVLETLRGFATLSRSAALSDTRDAVPVPPRKFPTART